MIRARLDDTQGRQHWLGSLLPLVLPAELVTEAGPSPRPDPPRPPEAPTALATRPGTALLVVVLLVMGIGSWFAATTAPDPAGSPRRARSEAQHPVVASSGDSPVPERPGSASADVGDLPLVTAPPSNEAPRTEGVTSAEPGTGETRGIVEVRNAETGQPIPGATVLLGHVTEFEPTDAATSDDLGVAEVPGPLLGRHSLRVEAPGYLDHREPARLRDPSQPYRVELHPCRWSVLTTRDLHGLPVVGVTVQLHELEEAGSHHESRVLETDGLGQVTFERRSPHTVCEINAPPFARVRRLVNDPRPTITLEEGQPVRGRVVDHGGRPLGGSRVDAIPRSSADGTLPVRARADDGGDFDLGHLSPGRIWRLDVQPTGAPAFRVIGKPPAEGPWLLTAPEGNVIEGQVLGPDDEPCAEGFVFVVSSKNAPTKLRTARAASQAPRPRLMPLARSRIGTDGRYRLGPMAPLPEPAYLFVHHPRYRNHLERLSTSPPAAVIHVPLEAGWVVRGQVLDEALEPCERVVLHVGEIFSDGTENIVTRARTDEAGRFTAAGLPRPGEPLPGTEGVVRDHLFIKAFPPDRLALAPDLVESVGADAFALDPEVPEITLFSAASRDGLWLPGTLRDPDGHPLVGGSPALLLTGEDAPRRGVVMEREGTGFFWCNESLGDLRNPWLLIMSPRGSWLAVDPTSSWSPETRLTPRLRAPHVLAFRDGKETALEDRTVGVGVPFGADPPRAIVPIGRLDVSGRLPIDFLPLVRVDLYLRGKAMSESPSPRPVVGLSAEWVRAGSVDLGPSPNETVITLP